MSADPARITFTLRPNVAFAHLKSPESVAFFGKSMGDVCRRCGAYEQTDSGHTYCAHVSCPIALQEGKRRRRPRTTRLERDYVPRIARATIGRDPSEALTSSGLTMSGQAVKPSRVIKSLGNLDDSARHPTPAHPPRG